MDPHIVEASAYHEAGHAVMAWCHGSPILEAGVAIDGQGSGHCNTLQRVKPSELLHWAATGEEAILARMLNAAELDAEEWQAGIESERRYLHLGRVSNDELDRYLRAALTWDPRTHLPSDHMMILRLLCEIRLAKTGRFVAGFGIWGGADDRAVKSDYRAIEARVALAFDEPRTWRAVQAVANALLRRGSLSAEQAHTLIEGWDPPRKETP